MKGYLRKRGRIWYTTIELPHKQGEPRKQKCVRIGEVSKAEAEERERDILRKYDSGEWLENRKRTVADLLRTWLEDNEHRISAKTWECYDSKARLHLIPVLGDVSLAKLTPKHVVDAYARIRAKGLSGPCVHIHRILCTAMNYGKKTLRVIKENVVADVPSPQALPRGFDLSARSRSA